MFIQTEATPDSSSLKFLPGRTVLEQGILDIHDKSEAANSPLAKRLFDIAGVSGVLFGQDHITITKNAGEWQHLKPALLSVIMEHFMSDAPVVTDPANIKVHISSSGPAEDGVTGRIWDSLQLLIDPELGYNVVGLGLIYAVTVDKSRATITMTTTTPGCPATDYLMEGARDRAEDVEGIELAEVELTYQPRWEPEMMSAEAKEYLGFAG
tara:strand:- start:15301 stop:15930 length:630 start_codon:yes stop_codon:yes gene_type:complete